MFLTVIGAITAIHMMMMMMTIIPCTDCSNVTRRTTVLLQMKNWIVWCILHIEYW